MPLFEIETEAHIIITWANNDEDAHQAANRAYPDEKILRLTKRPRDTWVISKSVLGINGHVDICHTARDCLSKRTATKCTPSAFTCTKPVKI